MNNSDWIALGALVVSVFALIAGEVRARRAKVIRNERSDVRWEFSWPEPAVIRVTNRGLDTAHRIDVEFTNDFKVSSGSAAKVLRDEYVDVPVPHLAEHWVQADAPNQLTETRADGTVRVVHFPIHFGALVLWHTKSGAPLSSRFQSTVYRAIDGEPRVVRAQGG